MGNMLCSKEEGVATEPAVPSIDVPAVAMGGRYPVTLDASDGGDLGLEVETVPGRRLLPIKNVAGGLAEKWNASAPAEAKLGAGDAIVEVNGTHGDSTAMAEALKGKEKLSLVVAKAMTYEHLVNDLEYLFKMKNCGPIIVRLSWHDAGVMMTGKGGCPNAAMRFTDKGEGTWAANAGLPTVALTLLGEITKKYVPDLISNADLWALAANVAIRVMGGPDVPTRFGRVDAKCSSDGLPENDGRLPDGDKGVDHLRAIFHPKGFSDRDIVALSGAHTVGKCHIERSGFDGQWTEDHLKFDNSYFKELLAKSYAEEKTEKGNPQCRHAASGTIMLKTDLALLEDPAFKTVVEEYAKDQALFFSDYTKAWVQLQEGGCSEGLRDKL